jgi:3'-phosphoadenosine 5'-phosphosulfate sulfotransferase (PAPS reductase)/FAD synthetase
MNPFRIDPPFLLSFSGGRTSGMMLQRVLDAWGGTMPVGGHVVFANTGREHAATYDFLEDVERHWCPVTWLEYRPSGFAVVTADTASRDGQPFAELIAKRKYLPNPITRFCTSDLKVIPMRKYMASLGQDDFTSIIGLRADEPRRVARLRSDPTRDIAMPLADAGVTANDVRAFWREQPFDLRLPNDDPAFGNCDLCFLKGAARVERVIRAEPERAAWWVEQERLRDARFRKDRPTYAQMLTQITVQGELFGDKDDTAIPCDCTE